MAEGQRKEALRWRNLKTGLLFLVGLTVAAWLGFYIGKNTGLFTQHRYVHLFVPDTKGLTEGNLVSVSGKKVGVVKTETFASQHDTNGIMVMLDIRDEYFGLIVSDAKATIKSLGILGDKYVDISIGKSHDKLPDGGTLTLATESGMDELLASAQTTMKNVGEITDRINRGEGTVGKLMTSNELSDKINLAVANINKLSDEMLHGKGLGPQLVMDPELANTVKTTLTNLKALSIKMNSGDGALGKMMVGEDMLTHFDQLAMRADSLMTELNNPNGNLAKLTRDDAMYKNINQTMEGMQSSIKSLDSLLTDLKANPGRYLNVHVF